MFRIALTFTLFWPFATASLAAGLCPEHCVGGEIPDSTGQFNQQQYVDSQLDWRSYYLHRMTADRVARSRGRTQAQQPGYARTN